MSEETTTGVIEAVEAPSDPPLTRRQLVRRRLAYLEEALSRMPEDGLSRGATLGMIRRLERELYAGAIRAARRTPHV